MNVEARDPSTKNIYRKNISAIGKEEPVFLHGGRNAKLSLEDALRKGVAELMQDEKFIQILLNPDFSQRTEGSTMGFCE